ncbi:hypothetical protein MSAN_01678100 [Mycena sanguinolenta]|uniref:Nab2 type CCCH zinc finger 4 domain-containing protein n=1 Tax=Mycena sanguinolenta TaxID=230812 RepID=A0A8H6Y3B7_9AGAR|nr:hypothetical protein MSAN_01678100 [Mycena sanguinolenta]
MPFGLTIGTERATALQQSIQDELTRRNYSAEPDAVMAEYITIMIINNKSAAQITSELEDSVFPVVIGTDFDPTFTDWLFAEAAKGATEIPSSAQAEASTSRALEAVVPQREAVAAAPSTDSSRRPRNGVYQQAISQAIPSTSPAGQKRTASARSPSPNHSNKVRRTDVPTGPRAMQRDGVSNPRSLLDRVGGPGGAAVRNNFGQDEIQSRIDNIVNNPTPEQQQAMMMNAGFPMGMEMMNPAMANPIMLQEMMMNQMALMAQMASTMGIINPATGQFGGGPAFGGMPGDMSMYGGMDGFQGPAGGNGNYNGRGRGNARGRGMGRGNGRGGAPAAAPKAVPDGAAATPATSAPSQAVPIVAPTPTPAVVTPAPAATGGLTGYILPERPQSPTLCKFGLKCTNVHCRYSHASPVATPESGVVLSNEACDKGKDCKDKDCIKAHVSPAVLNPQGTVHLRFYFLQSYPSLSQLWPSLRRRIISLHRRTMLRPQVRLVVLALLARASAAPLPTPPGHSSHTASNPRFAQPCHFGSACTRADCHFQHPEGRVLPTTFHRGLSTSTPLVSVPTPETGSMGATSHHRSVTFNQNSSVKDKLEKQMKEIEQKKNQAEQAVKAAEEAAANAKKEKDVKAVTISA